LKVGWPAWLAAQRVENSPVGSSLRPAQAAAVAAAAVAERALRAWKAKKAENAEKDRRTREDEAAEKRLKAEADAAVEAADRARLPPLVDVVERRSRLDRRAILPLPNAAPGEPGDAFVDFAWALVGQLNSERYDSAFETYLLSQIEGSRRGVAWFEECFGIEGPSDWNDLQRAAYARAGGDQNPNDK
jgi:hypothetical protein